MNEKKDCLIKRNIALRNKRREQKLINKKVCDVHFRCTENEKIFLEKTAKALGYSSVTEYILESSLFLSINYIELNYLSDFTVAINRLNNNVNQIARNLNRLMLDDTIDIKLLNQAKDDLAAYQIMINDLETINHRLQKKINSSICVKEEYAYDAKIDYKNTDMDMCPCSKEVKENGDS